jgi:tetratricopeptide (TPR) repeat protein
MRAAWIAIAVIGLTAPARGDDGVTARHLLAGVRAFQAARYDEALVELRIVQHAPDAPADLAFYLGPTLVKLGRDREAIDVFVTSRAARDALSDFYLGEAYYHAKLYRKAREVFASLRSQGLGPVLDEAAARYVAAVDAAYASPPTNATLDVYVTLAREAAADPVFAGELYDEARKIEMLAPDRHRHGEIVASLGATWNAIGRARAVVDVLATDEARTIEGEWQLARAYALLGDAAHARPLLEAIAKANGAHARDAAGMLAALPP